MILLTGASGFIGRHLIPILQERFGIENLICFTSKPLEKAKFVLHNNYNFKPDILVKNGYDNIELIIHAGSFTPKNTSQQNQIDECLSIITNTRKLFDLQLPKLKKILLLTTLDVYQHNNLIQENSAVNPTTLYGQSKLYQENLTSHYTKQHNLKLTIARLGHIYGPGEEEYQKLIPTVFNKIIKKEAIEIFGNENDLRSFLYVADACTVIANLAADESSPELINIVSSQAITIKKIVEQIISITESNITIQHNESKKIHPRSLTFDNTLMRKYLSAETTFEEGIKKEWEYLKKKYA